MRGATADRSFDTACGLLRMRPAALMPLQDPLLMGPCILQQAWYDTADVHLSDVHRREDGCISQGESKTMDEEIIFLVQESDEGGYEAKALGHSIHTEAHTCEDLKHMVQDAVSCHFEPEQRPRVVRPLLSR